MELGNKITVSDDLTSMIAEELGFTPVLYNPNNVFAVIFNDDFAGIVKADANVKSTDDLRVKIADIVDELGSGWTEPRVIAKHLVDGVFAKIRSMAYTAKSREAKTTQAEVDEARRLRDVYNGMVAKNAGLLEWENTEVLLGLQRDYKVIDTATYQTLYNNHQKVKAAIKAAQDAAKNTVLEEQKRA